MPRAKPVPTISSEPSWRDDAACAMPAAGMEDAWISEDRSDEMKARATCYSKCKVRYQCLLDAMTDEEAEGIRAGFHFDAGALDVRDRTKLRREFGFSARRQRKRADAA